MTEPAQDLLDATRTQLEPLFRSVIDSLDEDGNAYPMVFFVERLLELRQAETEPALLDLFLQLSTAAFQGFVLSEAQARAIDDLLASCETIALTLSAGDRH
jgi:hypothetical protein